MGTLRARSILQTPIFFMPNARQMVSMGVRTKPPMSMASVRGFAMGSRLIKELFVGIGCEAGAVLLEGGVCVPFGVAGTVAACLGDGAVPETSLGGVVGWGVVADRHQ